MGKIHVFRLGRRTSPTAAQVIQGGAAPPTTGSPSRAWATNGDGYDDVLVGADQHLGTLAGEGLAIPYYGSPSGLVTGPPSRLLSPTPSERGGFGARSPAQRRPACARPSHRWTVRAAGGRRRQRLGCTRLPLGLVLAAGLAACGGSPERTDVIISVSTDIAWPGFARARGRSARASARFPVRCATTPGAGSRGRAAIRCRWKFGRRPGDPPGEWLAFRVERSRRIGNAARRAKRLGAVRGRSGQARGRAAGVRLSGRGARVHPDGAECAGGECIPLDPPPTPGCGDGADPGTEECDDGNADDGDACLELPPTRLLRRRDRPADVEECDDGNADDTDDCRVDCRSARCGDDVVHAGAEECDDGNADDADGCTSACVQARCGDGIVHAGVEECDGHGASSCTDRLRHDRRRVLPRVPPDLPPAPRILQRSRRRLRRRGRRALLCGRQHHRVPRRAARRHGTLPSDCVVPGLECAARRDLGNGADDDCDTTCDDGFACCRGAGTARTTGCALRGRAPALGVRERPVRAARGDLQRGG